MANHRIDGYRSTRQAELQFHHLSDRNFDFQYRRNSGFTDVDCTPGQNSRGLGIDFDLDLEPETRMATGFPAREAASGLIARFQFPIPKPI